MWRRLLVSPLGWIEAGALGTGSLDAGSLEALFDGIGDAVFFVKNTEGQYVVFNQALARRCRRGSKREILGRTPLELFPPDLASSYVQQDRQVLDQGMEIRDRIEVHLYPDGTRGWCLTQKLPLHDDAGRRIGLIGVSKDLFESDRAGSGFREVAQAVEYIQENYAGPVRIEDLARLSGLPTARLERLTKRIFQLPPLQLLIRQRLQAACRMLTMSDATVTEIAHNCGYSEHSAFTRQFRAVVGAAPRAFRQAAWASGGAPGGALGRASRHHLGSRRVLRVLVAEGVDETLFRIAGGSRPGFDREILEGFARLHDLRLVTVPQPHWSDLLPALVEGEGDLIAGGYSVTPARRRRIAFSLEALPTRIVALSYRPQPVVNTLDELRDATIGVALGSSMREEALRLGIPSRHLREEPGYSDADLQALRQREVSVVLADLHSALISRSIDRRVQMGLFVGAPGSLAYGLRRDETGLRAALDDYIARLRRHGDWNRLVIAYWRDSGQDLLKNI